MVPNYRSNSSTASRRRRPHVLWRMPLASAIIAPILLSTISLAGSGTGIPPAAAPSPPAPRLSDDYFGWTNDACGSCHQIDRLWSHPVGVTPSMQVPEILPLVDGRITCITCHDNRSAADHADARRDHTDLLRGSATGASFCALCHNPGGTTRQDMHAQMLGQAHLPNETARPTGRAADAGSSADLFDADSAICLSCHDGSVATDIGHNVTGFSLGGGSTSHPIGMVYPRGGLRRDGPPLKPASTLDPRIHLPDGRVGCQSCHSPFSPRRDLLVMPNTRSALCLNCHDF